MQRPQLGPLLVLLLLYRLSKQAYIFIYLAGSLVLAANLLELAVKFIHNANCIENELNLFRRIRHGLNAPI